MTKQQVSVVGLAARCEHPGLMGQPHRHHEVEINFAEGGIAYLFGARHVQIADGQVAVFWAALPHRLVRVDERVRLTWLTVPLARVLRWELPSLLTVHLLEGHPVLGSPMDHMQNAAAMRRWLADINSGSDALSRAV